MFINKQSIAKNTKAFRSFADVDLKSYLGTSRLIGFGENPHGIREYYPIVRDLVQDNLVRGCKVLVLLENEYWLNHVLDDFVHGRSDEFTRHTFYDPSISALYGAGLRQFYTDLQELNRSFPEKLTCRHIDYFMNPLNQERSDIVKSVDPVKLASSDDIRQLQKDKNYQQFAEAREQFIFQEAIEAQQEIQPDVTILLMGSFHVGKQGGFPFGDVFVKSVMARLAEFMNSKPVSIRFSVLTGEYAKVELRNNMLIKVPLNCEEWRQEGIQIEFQKVICELSGDAFITDLSNINMPEGLAISYKDWVANHDYMITLRYASPDN
jgi:hypothetical protein